ncbi:MAG: YggS family pyridoxal phosphate-dependent enzyme [Halobacteria archaeon]|nr:YggS family pyridoxal phosphate-dependent enzyme [Halobacteria archaeon]
MSLSADAIAGNIRSVRERIQGAASAAGRDAAEIRLIAVSKQMPARSVVAAIAAGQQSFGENAVQDAATRQALIDAPGTDWHFIGHLQSNKAKAVAGHFDWLHTLDSIRLAKRLSDSRPDAAGPLRVLLQVNVARDPDKFGLVPDAVYGVTEDLLQAGHPGIELCGLMTIGQRRATEHQRRAEFIALRELAADCADRFGARYFTELSMGMSDDFETAIEEGATMVRVGSAIFGPRPSAGSRPG